MYDYSGHSGRLRVALISEYYYPDVGGIPEHMHHLGRFLSRRGHEVSIVTTRYPESAAGVAAEQDARDAGVEVVRVGRASGQLISNGSVSRAAVGLSLGRELAALFARRRFDVIHVHGPIFPVLPLLAIRHAPADALLLGTLHCHFDGSLLMRVLRGRIQRYLDALDGVIAVSDTAAYSMERLGFRFKAQLIPNGVDLDYWQRGRQLPELCDGRVNLLVQARLEPRNDVSLIIEALRRLWEGGALQRGCPLPRLVLVGDGPMRQRLEEGLPPGLRGPEGLLHHAGARIGDRNDYSASADIYCFTARIASHPMSLLEGMAASLPIITHDIAGARELISHGVEGLVVKVGDAAAYAAALERLLSDETLRRRMGHAARLRAEQFGWRQIAGRIEELYLQLLLRKGRAHGLAAPGGVRVART